MPDAVLYIENRSLIVICFIAYCLLDIIGYIFYKAVRIMMNIYTPDILDAEQEKHLLGKTGVFVYKPVSPEELRAILNESDMALHVESLEGRECEATKHSFSTKIMDCLSSGCSVFAVCREDQAGFCYIRENGIGFTASNKEEIADVMRRIVANPELIIEQARMACDFGRMHHQRAFVQRKLLEDMEEVVREYRISTFDI